MYLRLSSSSLINPYQYLSKVSRISVTVEVPCLEEEGQGDDGQAGRAHPQFILLKRRPKPGLDGVTNPITKHFF